MICGKKPGKRQVYVEPEKIDIAADPVVQYMSREALEKSNGKHQEINGKGSL